MFDPRICTKNLGIPVRVSATPVGTGGYTNMLTRCIVINPDQAEDTRVWVHEIAHALLDYSDIKEATHLALNDHIRAKAEICADTTAFIVCSILGCAKQDEYRRYMKHYIGELKTDQMTEEFINDLMPRCKDAAYRILIAGGYYHGK